MKHRTKTIFFVVFFTGVLTVIVHWLWPSSEPKYQGKTVTQWLKQLCNEAGLSPLSFGRGLTNTVVSLGPRGVVVTNLPTPRTWEPAAGYQSGRYQIGEERSTNGNVTGTCYAGPQISNAAPIVALRAIGKPAVPHLTKALLEQDDGLRAYYRRVYPTLVKRLGRWAPKPPISAVALQQCAFLALEQMVDVGTPALPALFRLTASGESWISERAFTLIARLGPVDPEVITAIDRHVQSGMSDEVFFLWVRRLHLTSPVVVQRLTSILEHAEPSFQNRAVSLLADIGAPAKAAVPSLVKRLKASDPEVRTRAADTISAIGGEYTDAGPALLEALNDPDARVRNNAAIALGGYGAQARAALPQLLPRKDSTNSMERYCARLALKAIDREVARRAGVD